ncbi:1-deoxy-D-xylulose-5-phosphate reductoisomerase [Sphingobium sp. CCH11-B1]|jgi:1-deoxy-D-xylulose-5-phosphate reductoisomerase|uniref:1-deoxy-D-xylulose-5-phosphate reductoisomerase n=1 Tax=Sphingobium sp. CCH11-B1 TaxID=1768781 RepID=UPI00082CC83B|nr:1-deoxy-D-xylulose-5-phosphate reductoisomerase [Sphingobium sp. CCH11-B1]MEA3389669.1 1-deoxy-D-xylulose-5-phosphate reductoisomerase [Pseudomonadota bacterium]
MKRVSIFGATGSVGLSTLDLVRRDPQSYRVVALTANSDVDSLAAQARETGAQVAVIAQDRLYGALRDALAGSGIEAAAGEQALVEAAGLDADWTMAAIVGCAGLKPTMAALKRGGAVALANKESLVSAGGLMMQAATASSATLLPVDSEHNAIFQCLASYGLEDVARIILTASGGPFRTRSRAEMADITPAQAVAHPNWSMGAKISVDSATMMNKGLELIEAAYLFPVGLDRIEILVHPQSVIHSMVEYRDRSTLAQLGSPDMRIPIAHALAWPERIATPCQPLDLVKIGRLDFEAPDEQRFPALRLARDAAAESGAAPAILNAANEVAVAAFLAGRIGFLDIAMIVEDVLQRYSAPPPSSIDDVLAADAQARAQAGQVMERLTA